MSVQKQIRISPEVQYQQEYESWRQHDRFIWQMPSIIITVAIAAIVTAWAVEMPWQVRECIILASFILTSAMFLTLNKHRYFIDLEQLTLLNMEAKYAELCIQRLTDPKDKVYKARQITKDEFWAPQVPQNKLQGYSAHRIFKDAIYWYFS
ncbi:MAG: hypothetical protein JW967_06345 [Dehalococcoidales bacterium]|nr:hypothetical protein [Dehalococcoidales bacterium]